MKDQTPNKLRRKMLVYGGLALVASALPVSAYLCAQRSGKWSFIERQVTLHPWNSETFVALGPKELLTHGSKEYEDIKAELMPLFQKEIERKGFEVHSHYSADARLQLFGYPEEPQYAEPLRDYCKTATDFLYSRIKGLDQHSIDWHVLKQGENFETTISGKGNIGHCVCDVYYVTLTNTRNPTQTIAVVGPKPSFRGGANKSYLEEHNVKRWRLFIGTGEDAILEPFSEVIPLTTVKSSTKYMKQVGHDAGLQAEETISESMSHLLSLEIAKELSIPRGVELIEASTLKAARKEVYSLVPRAISWLQKNGIQQGFDLYMQSAKEFMTRINS